CGKPVCGQCVVKGPTGNFCCESCQQKNEMFAKRAQDLEKTGRMGPGAARGGSIVGKLIALVVLLAILAVAAAYLNVPVVGPLVRQYLPFLPLP
ncbi:MAG: hypothetical protein NTU83_15550, partial [Candidatus Hydrogenedentes bacterium]|nr:hypothetical protein [Candidatus Hydrogenedentota bacterium]